MQPAMTFKQRLALRAYTLALRLLIPAILLRYWLRGRKEPGYRDAMRERLGYGPQIEAGSIWVHAVSLGETRASSALIDALRLRRPEMRLLLTHGTATGRDAGQVLLRTGDRQSWLPLDTPGAVRRFLQRTRPAIGVLMETEIWPNLLHGAEERGVPMVPRSAWATSKSIQVNVHAVR